MATILIVEDDVDFCHLISGHLEADGHVVYQSSNGIDALKLVEKHSPDLLILDWMLPGMDGLAVCRQVRQNHLMPIMMLTARSEEVDRVLGLEVGADDYVVKPFSVRELLARVRAIMRRVALDRRASQPNPPIEITAADAGAPSLSAADPPPITRGPLRIDPAAHVAVLDDAELELTPKEFELLALFAANPGRAFSRKFLVERVWGYQYDGLDRTVDTQVTRLRKKLGALGEKITSVWGVGYRFNL